MAIEVNDKHYRLGAVTVSRTNQDGRAISYEVFERVIVPTRMTAPELWREWAQGKNKEDMNQADRDAWTAEQFATRLDTYWEPTRLGGHFVSNESGDPEAQAYRDLMARFPEATKA